MAKEQQTIGRSILIPTQNIQPGNAFDRLGEAAGQMGQLVSQKATALAIEQSAQQGVLDVEKGKQPKELAFPLTKATKAYNQAVSNVEAQRMIISANSQIQQSLLEHTNPATFNHESPAKFQASLEGILQGTLENARDENREAVRESLMKTSAQASLKMLDHSIQHDNKQMKTDFLHDVNGLQTVMRNAAISGNQQEYQGASEALQETLDNYSVMNEEIKQAIPDIRNEIEQHKLIDEQLHGFATAASEGNQAQFLADFMKNKQELPFDVWQKAAKELVALDSTDKRLTNELQAQQGQEVSNGIRNGTIQTAGDILQFPNLSVTQQLQKMGELQAFQQTQARSQNTLIEAQKNILQGNAAFNTGDQKNKLFENARTRFEQDNGHPMGLMDMWQSLQGTSPYPISGIQGLAVGSHVPQFDAQLTAQLTSNNPEQVMQAAAIVKDAQRISQNTKQPDMVNISGDALSIASHFNALNLGGVDPTELAQRVSDITLKAKDPEIQERSQRFNREISSKSNVTNQLFKETFGTSFQPGVNDAAMNIFKETLREHYLKTSSKEAAIAATQYELRAWGTSKYFEDGTVAQPAPEKELNITKIGEAFNNQLRITTQNIIDQNAKDRQAGHTNFKIEWASPDEQSINIKDLSDEDLVFKPLGFKERPIDKSFREFLGVKQPVSPSRLGMSQDKPRVKINGVETELYLQPTPESRLGTRLQYALFYHDKFGMSHPVSSLTSPNGVAMFAPQELEQYAPKVFESQMSEKLRTEAVKIQQQQAKAEFEALKPTGIIGRLLRTTDATPEQSADIFRRLIGHGTPDEIESILKQRIQGTPQQIRDKAARADNVGIKAEPEKPGAD